VTATAPVERLIIEVAAAGGVIQHAGDKIKLTAPQPLPADLFARIREAKPALLAILAEASDWRDLYEERAAIREFDGGYPRAEAERLAWGELEDHWHRLHGGGRPCGNAPGAASQSAGWRRSLLRTATACTSTSSIACSASASGGAAKPLPRCARWGSTRNTLYRRKVTDLANHEDMIWFEERSSNKRRDLARLARAGDPGAQQKSVKSMLLTR
jgi:hypothetical protein